MTSPSRSTGRLIRQNRYVRGFLSALFPGLGQLVAREYRLALLLGGPVVLLVAAVVALVVTSDPVTVASRLLDPAVVSLVLAVEIAILVLRLVSVGLSLRVRTVRPGRGMLLAVAIVAFVVVPQTYVAYTTEVWGETMAEIFAPSSNNADANATPDAADTNEPFGSIDPSETPYLDPNPFGSESPMPLTTPAAAGRVTVLLTGIDSGVGRSTANTDTMILASLDPVANTVSMLSIPRDTVNVPLPDGRTYTRKLNSLVAWANHHPGSFKWAKTSQDVLAGALSQLTGIQIDYWAQVDLYGLIRVVDSVGGVNVNITRAFCDPNYDEYGINGFAVVPGRYHMNGKQALAYARIRHAAGESDFTRAQRQQEVIVALRDRIVTGGMLGDPIAFLRSVGKTISTNLAPSVISEYASHATAITRGHVYSEVVDHPLVKTALDYRGYVLIPDIAGIRALAARVFPPAGTLPIGIEPMKETATGAARNLPALDCHPAPATPTPTPSVSPSPSAVPTPSPTAVVPTPSPTSSHTPTPTPTPSHTASPTPTPEASEASSAPTPS